MNEEQMNEGEDAQKKEIWKWWSRN